MGDTCVFQRSVHERRNRKYFKHESKRHNPLSRGITSQIRREAVQCQPFQRTLGIRGRFGTQFHYRQIFVR